MRRAASPPSERIDRRLLAVNASLLGTPLGVIVVLSVAPTAATGLPVGAALGIALAVGVYRMLDRLAPEILDGDRPVEEASEARPADSVVR